MAVQVPRLPTSLQTSHCPSHLVLQQTPSVHAPLVHARGSAQGAPTGAFTTQTPAVHHAVASHWLSVVHDVPQVEPSHANGAHAKPLSSAQLAELPEQTMPLTTPAVQVVTPQAVPVLAKERHLPEPSQRPSALQETG